MLLLMLLLLLLDLFWLLYLAPPSFSASSPDVKKFTTVCTAQAYEKGVSFVKDKLAEDNPSFVSMQLIRKPIYMAN